MKIYTDTVSISYRQWYEVLLLCVISYLMFDARIVFEISGRTENVKNICITVYKLKV